LHVEVAVAAIRPLDDDPAGMAAWIAESHPAGWLDRFADELDRRRGAAELSRVLEAWALSQADAARLFGVSRQAVAKWVRMGVPAERAAVVADLGAATDMLVRYLRRDRIPAVVRRPSAVLGGRSLVQMAATEPASVTVAVREMFDFSRVHA
jgi:predicted XRE-type DNA-binding protein